MSMLIRDGRQSGKGRTEEETLERSKVLNTAQLSVVPSTSFRLILTAAVVIKLQWQKVLEHCHSGKERKVQPHTFLFLLDDAGDDDCRHVSGGSGRMDIQRKRLLLLLLMMLSISRQGRSLAE